MGGVGGKEGFSSMHDSWSQVVHKLSTGLPPFAALQAQEISLGHELVRPGNASWLRCEDWPSTVVVSRTAAGEVRIVLVHALRPGTGAFRRLVDGILAAGLRPAVVAPVLDMPEILSKWGWRMTVEDGEEVMRPRWPAS